MPAPISRLPGGLLDMLLVQSQGRNPRDLVDTVQPTLPMEDFYTPDRLEVTGVASVVTSVAAGGTLTVPAAELWLVRTMGMRGTFATALQELEVAVTLTRLDQTLAAEFGKFPVLRAQSIAQPFSETIFLPKPILLRAGLQLVFSPNIVELDGEANIIPTYTITFTKFLI